MSTTMVFIELLSAGTLAALSLVLALFGFGLSPEIISKIPAAEVVVTVVAIAFVYPLGIVVDGIADKFLSFVGAQYETQYNLQKGHSVFSLLFTKPNGFSEKYFEYNRIRTRMVRSFLLNSALMLVTGFAAGLTLKWPCFWLMIWVVLWVIIALLAYWSLHQLRESWFRILAVAWGDWPIPEQTELSKQD